MSGRTTDDRALYARQWHEGTGIRWFVIATFAATWTWWVAGLAIVPGEGSGGALICMASGLWWPGVVALLVTVKVLGEPLRTTGIARRGPWPYYLQAWAVPIVGTAIAVGLSLALGAARLDPEFTVARKQLQAADAAGPGAAAVAPGLTVLSAALTALSAGVVLNGLFALGEELGWRGFLLPRLLRFGLGPGAACVASGVIWGVWHAPLILLGYQYPGQPLAGLLVMAGFGVLFGTWLAWLRLASQSVWPAVLAHATLISAGGLPAMVLQPGYSTVLGGSLTSVAGLVPLGAVAGWLAWSGRLRQVAAGDAPAV